MRPTLYAYQSGHRPDGLQFAIGHTHPDGSAAGDLALFVSKVDAHLYVRDTAERLHADVVIMPSAGLGANRFGWPLSLIRADDGHHRRGDVVPMCPQCSSFDWSTSIRPAGYGTGPGRRWRMGDPGGFEFIHCHECQHENEEPR